ncbi:LamG-like jellyroll fold domain-containing protein [uncultured Microscilla sp.]|uniref:LamG-like jellyroll fold domain-containing protein n=1 Tax=uncultured Microscilla sp. TaxID=432653 RepID=UPI00262DA1C5|nr:LamG-like jellyroll fold domain-containing protein [uncultured Microscilla sp.]
MQMSTHRKLCGLTHALYPQSILTSFVHFKQKNLFKICWFTLGLWLCWGAAVQAQVAYNNVDNFDRADNNSLGAPWIENEADPTQLSITGNVLNAVNAGLTGLEPTNATRDLTAIHASFDLGQSKIGWSFHMDFNRPPTGWGTITYGLGWVLTANETDLSSATVDGYALLWTKTNEELVLVRFENGIAGDDPGTIVVSTGLTHSTVGSAGVNVRVEVTAEGVWTVYWEAGVALAIATDIDAGSATGTDNTLFADANQKYTGPIWAHNTGIDPNNSGNFDNFSFGIETSDVTLASSVSTVAANVIQGSQHHPVYTFDLAAANADATLTQVSFTTAGTYTVSDINAFTLWFSADNTLDVNTDQAIASLTTALGAGAHTFTAFTQAINGGTTGYFFVTTNVAPLATANNTIEVTPAITTADLTFSGLVNKLGTAAAGGTQTIVACNTPDNVTNLSATALNTEAVLNWANGNCYDEILVVVKSGSVVTNAPTGDGSAYTADAAFGSGTDLGASEFVVFKGTATTETITSLTNNTTYFFKAFGRKGTNWSSGVELSTTPRATLLTWDFDGLTGNETNVVSSAQAANVSTISPSNVVSRGAGVNPSPNGDRFTSDSWATTNNTIDNAIATDEYVQWTIETDDGFAMSLSSVLLNMQRSATGPNSFVLRSSLDGYTSNLAEFSFTTVSTTETQNIALSGFDNLVQPITFRLYGAGATNVGGNFGFETTAPGTADLAVYGVINAVSATIATSTNTLTGFGASTAAGAGASASQSFRVSAESLTADVAVALSPTTGFELSTDNITFSSTLTDLGRTGNDLTNEPVTIYVRLKPGLAAGNKSATITLSSTGAVNQVVTLLGNAVAHNGLAFDGTNDFVGVSGYAGIGGTSARTVEAWVKTSNTNAQVITRWGASNGEEWLVQITGGRLQVAANGKSNTGTSDIADGNWHHVAVTFANDGTPNISDAILYVDGTVDASSLIVSGSFNTNILSSTVLIGKNADDTRFFEGTIDELRIWSVARTPLDIQEKMRCELTGTETGLEAYYNFNQGVAEDNNGFITALNDATANARNGDLNNFDLTIGNATSNFVAGSAAVNVNREINLRGNGIAIASGDVTPVITDDTDFGDVSANTALTRIFTIENTGTETLTLTNPGAYVTLSGAGTSVFSIVQQPASGSIAGGGSQTFAIRFTPNNVGTLAATVTIRSNDCDENLYTFTVQGTGTPRAPLAIEALQKTVTLDFRNYTGTGVSANPTIAQLHSTNWAFSGMSDGQVLHGETNTTGDYAQGTSTGGVSTPGLYAFDINSNTAFGLQANGTDFNNGKAILRLQNQTGSTITAVQVAYNLFVFNDQDIASTIDLEYSTDGVSYTALPDFTFTSPTTSTGATWSSANALSGFISGLRLAGGAFLYLRWSNALSAAAEADEIALDDIQVTAYAILNARTNALSLDGTGDYVEAADNNLLDIDGGSGENLTIDLWAKFATTTGTQTLLKKRTGTGQGYELNYDGTQFNFIVENGSNNEQSVSYVVTPSVTDWTHIAARFNSTNGDLTLYVNGVERANSAGVAAGFDLSNTAVLRIGADDAGANGFNGAIDELSIWTSARTEDEIRENMHLNLLGDEASLVAYYQLSEAAGSTTTAELIGFSTGTLHGNATFITSTINLGRNGTSNTQTVGAGGFPISVDFNTGNDANLTMSFSAHSVTEKFAVTYQQYAPNATTGIAVSETNYSIPRWTINKANGASTFTADVTFHYPDNTFDNLVPRNYVLYNRAMGADGTWTKLNIIPSAMTANTIKFDGVTTVGQFMVVREQDKPDTVRGQMLSLDGTGDQVEIADQSSLNFNNQSFTVELWAKSTGGGGDQTLISKRNGVAGYELVYKSATNQLEFTVRDAGAGLASVTVSSFTLSTIDWTHLAVSYNATNGEASVYVNGLTPTTVVGTVNLDASNALPLRIGADGAGANFFQGTIDEVRLWNTLRTANELRENMHLTLLGTETNLVGYWQFNNDARDYIGGNDGTLNGNASVTVASTVNVGRTGASQTVNVPLTTTGNQDFTASANVSISITAAQAVANDGITVTYQQFIPNANTNITGTTLLDNPMWTINKSTSNGTFTGDITFTFPTNVFTDRYVLGNYELYRRDMGADGAWTITNLNATAITDNTITFTGFDNTHIGQLMVVRTSEVAPDRSRGSMLTLDGVGDYVEIADDNSLDFAGQNFTISLLVKANGGSDDQPLISKRNGGAGYELTYKQASGQLEFTVDNGAGSMATATVNSFTLSAAEWTHVAVSYNGATGAASVYINGQNPVQVNQAAIDPSNALALRIGANMAGTNFFQGFIDEVRLWNTVRSQDQIREAMHLTLRGSETGIVSYYQFNGDSNDDIGTNNGTPNGNASIAANSTVNVGRPGATESHSIAAGAATQNFSAANVSVNFTAHSTTENFTATYQQFAPNAIVGITGTTLYQNPMWTINKAEVTATFTADITFTFPANTFDQFIAAHYALYRRNVGADGTWTLAVAQATAITSTSITFEGINDIGQYMVVRTTETAPTGSAGNCLSFDGATQYLSTATVVTNTQDNFTIEGWVRWDGGGTADRLFFYNGDSENVTTTTGYGVGINEANTVTAFIGNGTATLTELSSGKALATGEWVHIALVRRATNWFIYVDGVEFDLSNTSTPSVPTVSTTLGGGTSGAKHLNGRLEEWRMWSVARSIIEIRERMHLINFGNEANLIANWQLNETSGSTAFDYVGDFDATHNNTPTITTSTAPIGRGVSNTTDVSTVSQDVTFGATRLRIVFGNIQVPGGDVVVTRLDAFANTSPTLTTASTYWVIHNYGANPTFTNLATVEVTLPSGDEVSNEDEFTPANIKLFKRASGSDGSWGASLGGAASASNTTKVITFSNLTGFTSFSQVLVGSDGTSGLPVVLASFEAKRQTNAQVQLRWTTISEHDNAGFAIEKSHNGTDYQPIGFVEGAGNSAEKKHYQFIDNNALSSAYYRLKQVDINGETTYSQVRFVQGNDLIRLVVYPNPFAQQITLSLSGSFATQLPLRVTVITLQGKTMVSTKGDLSEVQNALNTRIHSLPTGTYLMKVVVGGKLYIRKVVKE